MIAFDGSKNWEIIKPEKHKIIYDYNSKYILIDRQEPERDDQGNTYRTRI